MYQSLEIDEEAGESEKIVIDDHSTYCWRKLGVGLLIVAFCVFALLCYTQPEDMYELLLKSQPDCDDISPPYIYATTHDEVTNVLKYSLNGCLVTDKVLLDKPEYGDHDVEFRSMLLGRHHGEDVLFIADAMSKDSYILMYGECNEDGRREYIKAVANTDEHAGLDHSYGLCSDDDHNLYVSNQHTDNVLRFDGDNFDPVELPSSIRDDHRWRDYYKGTFVQFGKPEVHEEEEQGVRGIVRYKDTIWIANEDLGGVAVVSISTGEIHDIVLVHNPIGIHYDADSGLIFVGSKRKHWHGAVYAIDPNILRIIKTYKADRMTHPTGITSHKGILYVAEQVQGKILQFDIDTEEYMGTLVKSENLLEQLIISPC